MNNEIKKSILILSAMTFILFCGWIVYHLNGGRAFWVPAAMVFIGVMVRFVIRHFWP